MKKLLEIINEKLKIKNNFSYKTGIPFIINSIFDELFEEDFDEKIINIVFDKTECNLLSTNDKKDYIFCIPKYNDYVDVDDIRDVDENFYNSLKGAICADIIYRKDEYQSHKYNINKGLENVKKFLMTDLKNFYFNEIENEYLNKSSHTSDILLWNSKYTDLNYELNISFDVYAEQGMKSNDYYVPDDPDEFYLENLDISYVNVSVNNDSSYDNFNIKIPFNKDELKELSKKLDNELDNMVDIDEFDIYDYL